jgi:hypothetical protein
MGEIRVKEASIWNQIQSVFITVCIASIIIIIINTRLGDDLDVDVLANKQDDWNSGIQNRSLVQSRSHSSYGHMQLDLTI